MVVGNEKAEAGRGRRWNQRATTDDVGIAGLSASSRPVDGKGSGADGTTSIARKVSIVIVALNQGHLPDTTTTVGDSMVGAQCKACPGGETPPE